VSIPPASVILGMDWTTSIINAVMQSPYWNSTAIVITWDDYGGFYDVMAPPELNPSIKADCIAIYNSKILNPDCYLGFRVPALIISPYSKQGYIDNTQYSFESILRFIEWNWGLPYIGPRDEYANNINNAFNFSQTPKPPYVIPMSASETAYVISQAVATAPDTD
jgi:phospholipase C